MTSRCILHILPIKKKKIWVVLLKCTHCAQFTYVVQKQYNKYCLVVYYIVCVYEPVIRSQDPCVSRFIIGVLMACRCVCCWAVCLCRVSSVELGEVWLWSGCVHVEQVQALIGAFPHQGAKMPIYSPAAQWAYVSLCSLSTHT